ncbi:aspartyl protease family protein [Hymenobacter crusticola]|uniref:aspartyl protease family protein n=1 Tax=Hymenobacter crusticola TaxID=1770526 RepID=UPI000A38E152|nr:aspartyl protease family protein [Hymenobacter crusticola]
MRSCWSFVLSAPGLRWRSWLLSTCVALSGWLLCHSVQAQPPAFRFLKAKTRHSTVPFELQRNLIIVQVMLNGRGPYNFLLDTGVNISLITEPRLRDELGLRRKERFRVMGAGNEGGLEAYQVDSVRVTLGRVEAPILSFLVLSDDVLDLSGYVGMPMHGIIGSDLFQSFVLRIHPQSGELELHDPLHYKTPRSKRWSSIPLILEGGKAYLTTTVALEDTLKLPLKFVLDTGAGHALSLEVKSDPRLTVPAKRLRSQLGRGLNGFINGYIGRVANLQLGKYQVTSLLTSFPDADQVRSDVPRNGNIGFELLKRFELIIDYPHNRLMLQPNSLFRDPFEHDMCGIELLAAGPNFRRYFILRVEPSSPADQAGLQAQDEILSVNLLPTAGLTLTQMSRLFHSADGRQLLLIIRRPDGELVTTAVRLKRQI